jgi:putative membrane-bound dehydrogenase-like protein
MRDLFLFLVMFQGAVAAREGDEPTARSPAASLQSIRTRPGFKVELVAAEPLVESPVAFDWGPDGKFWVVEMRDYPLGLDGKGRPGGRIKVLEDTHGNGKYDKATIFLDNIGFPTGIMVWGKGVIVTCAPEIFYAEDTDGDGKADVRLPLFLGFQEGNQQHRVNGPVWGLDNWVYCANGDSGGVVRSVKSGKTVDIRGRDVRIRPDEGLIETESGQTQFGRSRDDWGNWFGCNNSDPMYHYALADSYLRRNPRVAAPNPRVQVSVTPGASRVYPVSRTLPRFNDLQAANHFTSACSAIVYRDDLFGPGFANNTFVSEPVHNLIHREIMKPKGFTFTSRRAADEEQSEFLASSDNWFRPTSIKTGPDGALWIADMYRHVIEHPEWIPKDWQKRLDLREGSDKGRIYRVHPVGVKPRPIPRLDRLDTASLVAALDSPSGWQRDLVQQMLLRRRDPAAVPLLEKHAGSHANPLCRLHALCTLDGLRALTPEVLLPRLADSQAGVRRHAIRLCEGRLAGAPVLGTALLARLRDPDAQVRIQLACTLGEWDDPRAGQALAELILSDPGDPFLSAAAISSARRGNVETFLLTLLARAADSPAPALNEILVKLVRSVDDDRTLAALLEKLAVPARGRFATWQLAALSGLLDALEQQNGTLAQLARNRKAGPAPQTLAGLTEIFQWARKLAANDKAALSARLTAVTILGRGLDHQEEDRVLMARLLVPQTAEELQLSVASALARMAGPRKHELLLHGWKSYSPSLRGHVLDLLFQSEEGVHSTLDRIEAKLILPFEIDAARRQRLLQHHSPPVRERAARLLAGSIDPDRQKVVDAHRAVLTMKGDHGRGVEVFRRVCAACHQLAGIGQSVGPELASLGDKSPQSLLVAILDPNRAVESRYLNYVAMARNGQTFTGILVSETGSSITLLGPDGKKQAIPRTDLEELASTNKSLMPEGLEKDLKPQDLADLVAFIRAGAPAPARKEFAGNRPALITPDSSGALHLLPGNCEIFGPSLVLEVKHGNLGFWNSEADRAVWSVESPRAGRYAVWFDWAHPDWNARQPFILEADVSRLTGVVQSTGSWDTYRKAMVGEISLKEGRQEVALRSAAKLKGPLIDLRSIKLVPIAGK